MTIPRTLKRCFTRRRRIEGERGLAMVETAIVLPLLALLMGGIVEYGTLWRDNLTVTTSSRAAARVVSNLGDDHLADYEAILSLDAALSTIDGFTIEGVLIYNAAASDGEPDSSCFDAGGDPQGSAGLCNYFSASEVAGMAAVDCSASCTEFPNNGNCAGGMSVNFCPQSARETDQSAGTTNVGVWVRIKRSYFTGIFPGDGVTITDRTVMQIEPDGL